jgi:hypothetical protein
MGPFPALGLRRFDSWGGRQRVGSLLPLTWVDYIVKAKHI